MNKGFLVIISSPSGGGKTSILTAISEKMPGLKYSVSTTTRPRRESEKDGRDYIFVSKERFMESVRKGEFAEWEQVHGQFYGTRRDFIEQNLRNGRPVLLDIDVKGALKLKKNYPDSVFIFIKPPSVEVLAERLRARGTDTEEAIQKRLSRAEKEMEKSSAYDYIVVNDVLDNAAKQVADIISKEIAIRLQ